MPIELPFKPRALTQDEFKQLDYEVMAHVFGCHNELGRLCDEAVYQADLAARLHAASIGSVVCEMPVTLSFREFRKRLYLDILVADGAIYELKVWPALLRDHEAQLLTYLFVTGIRRGKLVNFRPASVEHRFVNAVVPYDEQRRITLSTKRWRKVGPRCELFHNILVELLRDWGAFLMLELYEEALMYFLGGEAVVIRPVPLTRAGNSLGQQKFLHVSDDVAFRLTASTQDRVFIERDLQRLLNLTPLHAIQWVNLNRQRIEFTTLSK